MDWRQVRSALLHFAESRVAALCLLVSLVFAIGAVFAPLIAPTQPYDLTQLELRDALLPPGTKQRAAGQETRLTLTVTDAGAPSDPPALPVRAQACGAGCLQLEISQAQGALSEVQIRDLPDGASVVGGTRHPVRNWWTVTRSPERIKILFAGDVPARMDLGLIVKTEGQITGLTFLLGTDGFGRDMFSAVVYGVRISIFVGLCAAGLAMCIGTVLGLIAAWRGGIVDATIMRLVDFVLGFPALLIALIVLAVLGSGLDKVILAIVLVQWAYYARTAKSAAIVVLGQEYIEAARTQRFGPARILFRHVLPNCLSPLIVLLTINIASAISIEATLSFLGMGLPLTEPSLGMLVANGYQYIFSHKYWVSLYPGLILLVMLIAMNLVGDRLRELNDPHLNH